ncbi:MAG: phosphodiester glycosidase family protein, partial [Pseudoruegeria sp.]
VLALLCIPQMALAACETQQFEDASYSVCTAKSDQDLRLFHSDLEGKLYGGFPAVNRSLEPEGKILSFGMNAGMYHDDRRPVGLYIENGEEYSPIADGGGFGNFGLVPNGVFCINPDHFAIIETQTFKADPPPCTYATQSGPMLVIDGALHPAFLPDSDSTLIRNGVGVSKDGKSATFVLSDTRVNFDTFARFFRDALGLKQALFFDAKVSRIHAPEISRFDSGLALGVILGLVKDS